MPIAAKPLIAGALLTGVGAVWVPRFTGIEVPWMPAQEPLPPYESSLPSSSDPAPSETASSTTSSSTANPEVASPGDGIPLNTLQDVVTFLESRDGAQAPAPIIEMDPVASAPVTPPQPVFTTSVETESEPEETTEPTPTEPVAEVETGPTFEEQVAQYLTEHPLHTIIAGAGRTTATFGFQRVEVGDFLMSGNLRVDRFEGETVVLASEVGPVHVTLPPPGASTYRLRQKASPTPASAPTDATPE